MVQPIDLIVSLITLKYTQSNSVCFAYDGQAIGVKCIAEPGGSIRDDLVIEECNKKGMVMAFTGIRLFHH